MDNNQDPKQQIVWPIPSIFVGLNHCAAGWEIYSTKSEPFWSQLSKLDDCRIIPFASRGITLASETALPSVVFVPNRQLGEVIGLATKATIQAPLVLIVEDHPQLAPQLSPREFASRAGLCLVEPCDPSEVESCARAAAWMSITSKAPSLLVAHHSLLGSAASIEIQKDREQYVPRQVEGMTPLRLGRRLELNRQRTLPSPGEKVSVGFITVSTSDIAIRFLVNELELHGRVPMLNLRMISPLDVAPIERLLTRCNHVVVLEPRPGEVEHLIMGVAQKLQREGLEIATIWGNELPPVDPEQPPVPAPVDMVHSSVLVRYIQHLLHDISPKSQLVDKLQTKGPTLDVLSTRRTSFGTRAALQFLKGEVISAISNENDAYNIVIDGMHEQQTNGKNVYVETWGEDHFVADGLNVVRSASSRKETRILIVWRSKAAGQTLSTIVEAVLPSKADDYKSVIEITLDDLEELHQVIQIASQRLALSVIIVCDGIEPRFDIRRLSEHAYDIDRLGFRPQHAIVIPTEEMAAVRLEKTNRAGKGPSTPAMPLESSVSSTILKKQVRTWRISLRPLLERVEVTRTRPPVRVVGDHSLRLSPPKPTHANNIRWRAHIAGSRGDQPGVTGAVLINAGESMGYEVRTQCNAAFIGSGRRAWTQVLFTKKQTTRTYVPLVGLIPWGEADLLLGWDREELLRAIDPNSSLQVGSQEHTYAIINSDPLEQQVSLTDLKGTPITIDASTIESSCRIDDVVIKGFSSLARYTFHNERLGDLVQLGMAFQLGLIPVTVDAMHSAVEQVEKNGYARTKEAFEFGRRIAIEPDTAWLPVKEESQVDLTRLIRRAIHDFTREGKRQSKLADAMEQLINKSQQVLQDFNEHENHQTMIDVVTGIRRCMLWGGEEMASRFVDLICSMYISDSSITKRAMARASILPIAEALLVRDPIYLAKLSRSPEVVRKIRTRLNVRNARGDSLSRRFLSRFRLQIWDWSLKADLRTSDWSTVFVSMLSVIYPKKWRGSKQDRLLRSLIIESAHMAVASPHNYDTWVRRFQLLEQLSLQGTLHNSSIDEIKKILQS